MVLKFMILSSLSLLKRSLRNMKRIILLLQILKNTLQVKALRNPFVVGMMIHNCVNATVYSGVAEGFPCIVVEEAVNTMDRPYDSEVIKAQDNSLLS